MAYGAPPPGSLKRKRRRRQDRPALSAKIYLDSNLKGEVGVLSSDLSEGLFSGHPVHVDENGNPPDLWAAITPWTPSSVIPDVNWVILPVRVLLPNEKPLPPNTIRFPATASSTQTFVRVAQAVSPTKTLRQNTTVEIRVAEVVPLVLDTVFVSVDTDAIRRLEDVNKKYNGGFGGLPPHMSRRSGKRSPTDAHFESLWEADEKMKVLLNNALRKLPIIHTDDTIQLPLTHAVTHAPVPPVRVLSCEPVSQGYIAASTNIVVVPASDRRLSVHGNKGLLSPRLDEDSGEEDTANEAFFSASEDNYPIKPIVTSKSSTDMSNTDDMIDSSAEESNLSDDSDDMISLAKPGLTEGPSGISSALTSATPRPFSSRVRGSVINIGIQTPGSVFSNMTATTAKGGQAIRSKTFRAQGLYERISVDLLHPKPADDEDDEARVYVDATMLARLGCFSGDWVRIEPAESPMLPLMSAFGHLDDSIPQHWRPVRVYTLPEGLTKRQPRFPVNNRLSRRDSNTSLALTSSAIPTATIYLSPVLLANLKDPANISMSTMPIMKKPSLKRPVTPRVDPSSGRVPPTASEVTLRKIVTPISTERTLSNTLYANLKQYFEERQRIVKPGDIIAITIDGSLGRSVYEGEVEQDGSNASVLLSQMGSQQDSTDQRATMNVAWFSIEDISIAPSEDLDGPDTETWGDAALIDPTKMTMRQSGDARRRLPSATNNPWQYYLGMRKIQSKPASSFGGPAGLPEASAPFISPLQRRLRELISVSISSRAVHLGMPPLTVLITSTQRSIGKARVVEKACADLGVHFFPIDGHDIVSEGGAGVDVQAQGLLEARCERALDCGAQFTAICIKHIEVLNADRAAASLKTVLETCRVLVATTTDLDKVPDSVRGLFTHELEMSAPDEGEREGILRDAVTESGVATAADVDLSAIAVKTAALVAGDLVDVVDRAIVAKAERLETLAQKKSEASNQTITIKDIQLAGGVATNSVTPGDFDAAVDMARKNFADAIGAPKIPNVQWSDVGGLTNVKDAVIETIQLPLSRPELFAKGLKKRSGILFYGPPGTGKTLLAKAIATEFSLNFFSVKGPELLNMYIGESEANVRRVFQRARDARPCAVFFDELDSVAPKRGNQGDSGGVMDRIVSQLLAELDGMSDGDENGGGVFVIGATNRPDLLDQALLRPGRFDKMLYLGISDTHEKQATILQALTRKFTLDPSVSLPRVSESLPFTFTGADLYALCSDAMLKAVTRSARAVDDRVAIINADRAKRGQNNISIAYYFDHYDSEADAQVMVTEEDFALARRDLVPSVSVDELRHYEHVRSTFEGATKKPASNGEVERPSSTPRNNGAAPTSPRSKSLRIGSLRGSNRGNGERTPSVTSRSAISAADDLDGDADTDDDFVIRTDRLALNTDAGRGSPGKGKGKGKSRDLDGEALMSPQIRVAGDDDGDDGEDLYD